MTAQNDDKKTATDGSTDSTKTGTPTDTTSTTSADSTTKGSILTGTGLLPILKAEILNESGTKTILPSPDGFAVAIPLPGGNHVQHFGDADRATFNGFNQLLTWTKPSSLISGNLGGGEITQAGGIARGEQILSWGRWNGGSVTTSSGNTIHGIPLLFVTANAVNANSFPTTPPSLGVVTYDGTHGPGASAVRAGYLPNAISASITGASLTIDFLAGQASLAMSFSIGSKGNPINPAFDHTYSFSTNSIGRTGSGGSGDFSGSFTGTGTCTPSCSPLSIAGNVSIGLTGQGGYGLAVTSGGFRDSSSSLSASFIRIFEAAPVGSANNTVTTTAVAQ
jgi:hypothetical protein